MSTQFHRRPPPPALAGMVLRYTGFAERAAGPVEFRELPCTHVPLILDLAEGWSVADARTPARRTSVASFVAGLTDGPVLVAHPGTARCLQVDLSPLGARRLLGVPMDGLANRSVPLADVLGPGATTLVDRLADAPGWPARFALVDAALTARLGATAPGRPEVAWAMGRLRASGGGAGIGDLARELGWSHRRLIARFREEVGLPPKRVARIVRFERLQRQVGVERAPEWGRLAAACGYFDQAHLAREVRELAGMTPTALWADRVNFVQDLVEPAA